MSGREGEARAPSVQTEDNGIVLASYVYDDPQVATIIGGYGFDMILSTDTRSGDGMAIGVKSTSEGESGYAYAEGQWQPGGGNEIGMAISFRSGDDAGQYYSIQSSADPETSRPTQKPARKPTSTPQPSASPTDPPTTEPTKNPVEVVRPELVAVNTRRPTRLPSKPPTASMLRTRQPSALPTRSPSYSPSPNPTLSQTVTAQEYTAVSSGSSSGDEKSQNEGETDEIDEIV